MRNLVATGQSPPGMTEVQGHAHPDWELVYYLHGSGVLTCDDREFRFRQHDLVVLPPGVRHSERSDTEYRLLFFTFAHCALPRREVQFFHDTPSADLRAVLLQIHREFHLKRENHVNILNALLNVVYQYIVSWCGGERSDPYIAQFIDLLIDNIANSGFRLKDAMDGIPFTKDHFRRLFKEETGRTPSAFLEHMRIQHAKQMLRDKSYKIRDIALQSGYTDPYYFSRVFHKQTGVSPRTYDPSMDSGFLIPET